MNHGILGRYRWRGVRLVALAALLAACGDKGTELVDPPFSTLESATLAMHVTKATAAQYALAFGMALQPVTEADMYAVRYRTSDVDGHAIIATGAVWLPTSNGSWPTVVYMHGTSLPRSNAPSSTSNQEGAAAGVLFATSGYVAVLPDYVGMGSGDGTPLWQHAATEASAGADLLRAASELAAQKSVQRSSKLFVTGYSQGGHAAMALHRRLQEQGEFTVTAAAPMAGAYDISGTARQALTDNTAYGPTVLYTTYLLAVYNQIYRFAPSLSTIFLPPYDQVAADLLTGNYSATAISARLPTTTKALLQPAFLQAVLSNASHPLWSAVHDNDVYDWKPRAPVRLFHGGGDRDVPFQNALTAAARMQALGADVQVVNLGATLDHATAVVPAFTGALNFFATLR